MTTVRQRALSWLHRHPRVNTIALLLPAAGWLAVFFAIPLGIMATYMFRPRHLLGGVYAGWTTTHVSRLFESLYLAVLGRSVVLSLAATILALLVSYPHEVLIVMAYAYFASGFIGEFLARRRNEPLLTDDGEERRAKDAS